MKALAIVAFLGGLLSAVRVMFFGVQRRLGQDRLAHRRWPLALAAFLVVGGALLYILARNAAGVTAGALIGVTLAGASAGAGAWWLVTRSAAAPSSDPEDDPRYRFQGHVARVIEPIRTGVDAGTGRIAFSFDGRRYEFLARWTVEGDWGQAGRMDNEVVIERVEGDVAFVEPWKTVEQRL